MGYRAGSNPGDRWRLQNGRDLAPRGPIFARRRAGRHTMAPVTEARSRLETEAEGLAFARSVLAVEAEEVSSLQQVRSGSAQPPFRRRARPR